MSADGLIAIVELFDMSQGRDRVFAGIAEAARNWDGQDPIRTTLPPA